MKKLVLLLAIIATLGTSCTVVEAGHKGVKVSYGETDMSQVYNEGMHSGFSWLFADMVEYDVRERTVVQKFEFNDSKNMLTTVEIALDYALMPDKVNMIHTSVKDYETKLLKTLKSAGKEVIPQYTAAELNISKRTEAEEKLYAILAEELPEFYINAKRVQMTDVDLPRTISELAEQTAAQIERNKLAEKKEAEKQALAKALVAESKGKFEAAEYDAKTKDILSQPKMLQLMKLENERIMAEGFKQHGFGNNNMFGQIPFILNK